MFQRQIADELHRYLREFPAVAILGPRLAGKTTLARQLADELALTSAPPPCTWTLNTPPISRS